MNPRLQKQRKLVLAAGLLSAIGMFVPGVSLLLTPLLFLNTHLHELCHAMVATATGGQAQYILVFANGGGVTPIRGGSLFLSASAGYVGAALIGAAIIYFGRNEKLAKRVLGWMAAALALSMVIWVRGELVGVLTGLLWTLVLGGLAARGKGDGLVLACVFLGMQQALASLESVLGLYKITTHGHAQNDAGIMAQLTGIPAPVWAFSWLGLSFFLVGLALRQSWRGQ